jgi:SAM-dependent methyltransferase
MTAPRGGRYATYPWAAELYDHVVPYRERPDVAFYASLAKEAGGDVLELGCGTGRVLVSCARAGARVTGLDLAPEMLAICRRAIESEPQEVRDRCTVVAGDMAAFDLGRTFHLVTIPFRAFQHLMTVPEQLSCLAAARRHLVAGGRLALDLFNPSLHRLVEERYFLEHGDEPEFEMPDGRRVVRKHRIAARDHLSQVSDVELIYEVSHPDGRQERLVHGFRMRHLFRYEAEHLLARAGFEVEELYADFDRNPYGATFPGDLVFVARAR